MTWHLPTPNPPTNSSTQDKVQASSELDKAKGNTQRVERLYLVLLEKTRDLSVRLFVDLMLWNVVGLWNVVLCQPGCVERYAGRNEWGHICDPALF